MRNALITGFHGGIIFVPDDDVASSHFPDQGQGTKNENTNRPEPDGIYICPYTCEILPDAGHLTQHPGIDPVTAAPYFSAIGIGIIQIFIGIDGREPMPQFHSPVNRGRPVLPTDLPHRE